MDAKFELDGKLEMKVPVGYKPTMIESCALSQAISLKRIADIMQREELSWGVDHKGRPAKFQVHGISSLKPDSEA